MKYFVKILFVFVFWPGNSYAIQVKDDHFRPHRGEVQVMVVDADSFDDPVTSMSHVTSLVEVQYNHEDADLGQARANPDLVLQKEMERERKGEHYKVSKTISGQPAKAAIISILAEKYGKKVFINLTASLNFYGDQQIKEYDRVPINQAAEAKRLVFLVIFKKGDYSAEPTVRLLQLKKKLRHRKTFYQWRAPFYLKEAWAEYPFYHKIHTKHTIAFLSHGVSSLYLRLQMIQNAKKTIELESYIFENDMASKLITRELVAAVKRGVKVRVLLDYYPRIDNIYYQAMVERGIEVKLYNKAWSINPWQVRTHRKLLIIDDKQLITGGRNIGNGYFGIDEYEYYQDLDVYVTKSGDMSQESIVPTVRKTFDLFWRHEYSDLIEVQAFPIRGSGETKSRFNRRKERYEDTMRDGHQFVQDGIDDNWYLDRVKSIGEEVLAQIETYEVSEITFASDRPGKRKYAQVLSRLLYNRLATSQGQVIVEAPYFILMEEGEKIVKDLLLREVDIDIITNSRYSIAESHHGLVLAQERLSRKYIDLGLDYWAYSGERLPENQIIGLEEDKTRFELHGKSMIFGEDKTFVGTYNLDPRSKYYNAEMGFLFENDPFIAGVLGEHLERLIENSMALPAAGIYEGDLYDYVSQKRPFKIGARLSLKAFLLSTIGKGFL